jgi:hypothetical protein
MAGHRRIARRRRAGGRARRSLSLSLSLSAAAGARRDGRQGLPPSLTAGARAALPVPRRRLVASTLAIAWEVRSRVPACRGSSKRRVFCLLGSGARLPLPLGSRAVDGLGLAPLWEAGAGWLGYRLAAS